MMPARLERLNFIVGLVDKASGPAGKIIGQIDALTNKAKRGMTDIATGSAGLFATGYALRGMLAPSIEMDRALGEVRSLDVRESALQQLEKTALSTSIALGENASDIVRSSYDIQSAIAGLTDNELSAFTRASAILAKGTKSDTGTITDYMGTMYGIFQKSADAMGKAEWVQQLTGQTATAVQMFKTTGGEMAAAFGSLGADATTMGIGVAEQMAILGQLQSTMSGSEAGTKYRAFLAGVGKAQSRLGLQFTDSHGKLLPMMDILTKLRGKFGNTLELAESDALAKAFGSKEATGLIKLLMTNTAGLNSNIKQLSDISGMNKAIDMANKIADPWERLAAVRTAVLTSIGRGMLDTLKPLALWLTRVGTKLVDFADKNPRLARLLGIVTLSVFGLIAAFSTLAIIGGVAQLMMAGWGIVSTIAISIMALSKAIKMITVLQWLWNVAMMANPIGLIALAVTALIVGLAAVAKNWDKLKQAMANSEWLQAIVNTLKRFINTIISLINLIPGIKLAKYDVPALSSAHDSGPIGRGANRREDQGRSALVQQSTVPRGGLQQQINNGRSTHIEHLEVKNDGNTDGFRFYDELLMAGG